MITHDRYQRVKEIFFSAQRYPTRAERSAFLTEACGDDTAMREEVESLLTAHEDNADFLSCPAYELAAGMLADETPEFIPGQEVDQYKIECFLSSGGMGQIYAAHDKKLGRKVALKFISPEFATDYRRVQRFEQEARAASALNHPNVCVIHDVGVTDHGRHFIAMEFIVGTTVRDELVRRRRFKPKDALEISIQVGDALASAHARGIVHRDIKPENIMLRPDGYVKVVDFGLAKLTELLAEHERIGESETIVQTEPRTIMGTVKYMSPEQLREAPVDERTDIWSLGIVLYEMLTGTTPFDARAPNDSIALILRSTELQFTDDIPIPLREIVKKALEKDCTQRYQTVTKLTSDLRKLKWQWEHNQEDGTSGSVFPPIEDEDKPNSAIFTRLKSQAQSTADFLFSEISTHKTATLFAISILALFFLLFLQGWIASPATSELTMTRLTDAGTSVCAAISPDGKWVAHAEQQDGKQYVKVTNTTTPDSFIAVPADNVKYLGISFSRYSNDLYIARTEESGEGVLYRLGWPNTNLTQIKEGVDSPISFSPQGYRFAFVRHDEATAEYSLILSDIDGTNEQVVAQRKGGDTLSVSGVAWSPDGNLVFCPAGTWENGWHMNVVVFDLKHASEKLISNQSWFSIYQVAWEPDMNDLIINATERQTIPHQLWRISFPEGVAERITRDLSEYISVSAAAKKMVTVSTDRSWQISVVSRENPQKTTAIATGTGRNYGLTWTSKGTIVFSAMAQERLNIFRINSDGSKVQLTVEAGDNYMPASSPDGQFIVFSSNRNGPANNWNIWRMNADGSDPIQLTKGGGDFYPSVSPDNQWVAYDSLVKSKASVWKVPLAVGEPIKIVEKYRMPVFSPDGQFIACRFDEVSGSRDVAIFPAHGGEPLRHFNVPIQDWQSVQWLPNGHELSYVKNEDGYSNIWTYDIDTGASKQITQFNSHQIYAYAWSPDYEQIALLRGTKTNNVTVISNSER
jgi:serine/threonine protein kinase